MTDYVLVSITASSEREGEKIASVLVKERLAACVNMIAGMKSTFRWKGQISNEEEVLLIVKTKDRLFEKVKKRVLELHSYEVPEVLALPILSGSEKYLSWIEEETL
jgi:periplasmic divalent cation tolerance protein